MKNCKRSSISIDVVVTPPEHNNNSVKRYMHPGAWRAKIFNFLSNASWRELRRELRLKLRNELHEEWLCDYGKIYMRIVINLSVVLCNPVFAHAFPPSHPLYMYQHHPYLSARPIHPSPLKRKCCAWREKSFVLRLMKYSDSASIFLDPCFCQRYMWYVRGLCGVSTCKQITNKKI